MSKTAFTYETEIIATNVQQARKILATRLQEVVGDAKMLVLSTQLDLDEERIVEFARGGDVLADTPGRRIFKATVKVSVE